MTETERMCAADLLEDWALAGDEVMLPNTPENHAMVQEAAAFALGLPLAEAMKHPDWRPVASDRGELKSHDTTLMLYLASKLRALE